MVDRPRTFLWQCVGSMSGSTGDIDRSIHTRNLPNLFCSRDVLGQPGLGVLESGHAVEALRRLGAQSFASEPGSRMHSTGKPASLGPGHSVATAT